MKALRNPSLFNMEDEVQPQLPLFVFGTLRRGECNHGLLEGAYSRMLPAVLRDFERIRPLMIARRGERVVDGEIYFLPPDNYGKTMERCDELEGIPPGRMAGSDYKRFEVTVETAEGNFAAWAYVHPDTE